MTTKPTTPTAPPSNGRVLVVDDEQSTCELLEVMLRRQGVDVTWRTSPHDALDLVVERDFDVILTDLEMAGLSGIELCERILLVRPDMPVVVVTGDATMAAAVAAIRAGAYDFLTKPVDAALLSRSVSRALSHGRLRREATPLRQAVFPMDDVSSVLSIDDLDRRHIQRVLALVGGDRSRAADLLGLDRRTLQRRIVRYGGQDERAI